MATVVTATPVTATATRATATAVPTTADVQGGLNPIVGGWSSSISALLDDPTRRSSCCALTCCGVLLSDKVSYWAYGRDTARWTVRFIPVVIFLALIVLSRIQQNPPDTHNHISAAFAPPHPHPTHPSPYDPHEGEFTLSPRSYDDHPHGPPPHEDIHHSRHEQPPERPQPIPAQPYHEPTLIDLLQVWLYRLFLLSIVIISFLGRRARLLLRRTVIQKMIAHNQTQQRHRIRQGAPEQPLARNTLLRDAERHIIAAKGLCCCHPDDRLRTRPQEERQRGDFITRLFRCLLSACCGVLCGYWWQCCGMCAIGQEDREMERILRDTNPKALQLDYITFQNFAEYYPAILQIRQQPPETTTWKDHFRALSSLSRLICKLVLGLVAIALLLTILNLTPDLHSVVSFIVFVLTWGQAVLILYFIYWRWHRHTISLDAIIKYFASGFVLSVMMSIVYEMMLHYVLDFVYAIVLTAEGETSAHSSSSLRDHIAEGTLYIFFTAFIIAALVEETWKYFGFWMVETPDLMNQSDIIFDAGTPAAPSNPTRVVQGCNITIAMITVATGFACAENLEYIFGRSSARDEIFVFFLRALLPGHPLFAAIQSIGVVRRDIEQQQQHHPLGRILLPAVILHGLFDFVTMLAGFLAAAESDDDDDDAPPVPEDEDSNGMTADQVIQNLTSAAYVLPVILAGLAYYILASQQQRRRLQELDGTEGTALLNKDGMPQMI